MDSNLRMEATPTSEPRASLERDPVCGMSVNPEKARARVEHGGRMYYFCCEGCAQKFRAAPEKYLTSLPPKSVGPSLVVLGPGVGAKSAPPSMLPPAHASHGARAAVVPGVEPPASRNDSDVEYTCPMDPQIRPARPWDLPDLRHGARASDHFCGRSAQRRADFDDAALLGQPGADRCRSCFWRWAGCSDFASAIPPRTIELIQFALATPVVLWGGWPFFERGWFSIVRRSSTCSR